MVARKNFEKVAWTVTAVMLALTILFMNGKTIGVESIERTLGYETRLFDNSRVHSIDIYMDDWDSFIKNAASEEYSPATLIIDGEVYKNVAIRGKGNTSLSNVAGMNSQRYSFKIEFDHYDNNKSYYGLDKLALNNLIQDTTMMKDYLAYTMMNAFGVNAPLCSFVYITVNGEDWGLYLAVESVEDGFLRRNYGGDAGNLYKPDSTGFGGGKGNGREFNMTNFWKENFSSDDEDGQQGRENSTPAAETAVPGFPFGADFDPSQMPAMPGGDFDPSQMTGMPSMPAGEKPEGFDPQNGGRRGGPGRGEPGGGPGGGMGSSDVKLQYTDDELDSYSNIWNNAKTNITGADKERLIESLKKLSENEDIESVVDIDQVIRYFVVHNYVCNGDSYTGAMIHNYYLYEKDGQLAMIPWDYNLAFGTFQVRDAQNIVNTPIDTPVSGGSEDRPMLNWIFENEEYTEMYHQYFREFLETVDISGMIETAYELIKPYVEKDPTAFYTPEEFETGAATIKKFCDLRTQSIQKQLETGETVSQMEYADASDLTVSDMGAFGGGGGRDGGMQPPEFGMGRPTETGGGNDFSGTQPPERETADTAETRSEAMALPENAESDESSSEQREVSERMPGNFSGFGDGQQGGGRMMPPDGMPGNFQQGTSGPDMKTKLIRCSVSLLFLIAGLFIAGKYK